MHAGPPSRGLNDVKDEILDRLYVRKWKQPEVVDWLADNHDIKINIRTLQRHLKDWDALQQDRTVDTEDLRKRLYFLFCRWGTSDEEMLKMLQEEGFTVTSRVSYDSGKSLDSTAWTQVERPERIWMKILA